MFLPKPKQWKYTEIINILRNLMINLNAKPANGTEILFVSTWLHRHDINSLFFWYSPLLILEVGILNNSNWVLIEITIAWVKILIQNDAIHLLFNVIFCQVIAHICIFLFFSQHYYLTFHFPHVWVRRLFLKKYGNVCLLTVEWTSCLLLEV